MAYIFIDFEIARPTTKTMTRCANRGKRKKKSLRNVYQLFIRYFIIHNIINIYYTYCFCYFFFFFASRVIDQTQIFRIYYIIYKL